MTRDETLAREVLAIIAGKMPAVDPVALIEAGKDVIAGMLKLERLWCGDEIKNGIRHLDTDDTLDKVEILRLIQQMELGPPTVD